MILFILFLMYIVTVSVSFQPSLEEFFMILDTDGVLEMCMDLKFQPSLEEFFMIHIYGLSVLSSVSSNFNPLLRNSL